MVCGDGSVGIGHLRKRIVDGNHHAGGGDPFTEIAVVHFRSGDGERRSVGACTVAEAFIGEEENVFVLAVIDLGNPDRSAAGETEIVLLVNRVGDVGGVVEEVIRVEVVIAKELVGRAVVLIGPGFRDEGHYPCAVSVLRFIAAGIDGELVDGFDGGRIRGNPAFRQGARGVRGNAVQRGAVGGSLAAANHEAVIAAEVLGIGRQRGKVERRADGAADDQRQVVDQLVLESRGRFRILCLERNGRGLDLDRLRGGAYLEGRIGAHGLRGVKRKPSLFGRTEAGLFYTNHVYAGRRLGTVYSPSWLVTA